MKAAVRKYDGTVTATLKALTVFQRIGLTSGVTAFGLPGGNNAISGRRPDNSIENVKKYGRKYDRQNDVHRYPQWFSRPAWTLPAYFSRTARDLVSVASGTVFRQ